MSQASRSKVLNELEQQDETARDAAAAEFAEAVVQSVAGSTPPASKLGGILKRAGKSRAEFDAACELREERNAKITSLGERDQIAKERNALSQEIRERKAAYEKATAEFLTFIEPAESRLQGYQQKINGQFAQLERELIATAAPELRQEWKELIENRKSMEAERARAASELPDLQARLAKLQADEDGSHRFKLKDLAKAAGPSQAEAKRQLESLAKGIAAAEKAVRDREATISRAETALAGIAKDIAAVRQRMIES